MLVLFGREFTEADANKMGEIGVILPFWVLSVNQAFSKHLVNWYVQTDITEC